MSGRITPQCGTDLALDFGRGVRTYRQYLGMTIVQLSGESGVSIGAISTMEHAEHAEHGATLKNAIAVSRVLGKSIEELIKLGQEVNRKCRR